MGSGDANRLRCVRYMYPNLKVRLMSKEPSPQRQTIPEQGEGVGDGEGERRIQELEQETNDHMHMCSFSLIPIQ